MWKLLIQNESAIICSFFLFFFLFFLYLSILTGRCTSCLPSYGKGIQNFQEYQSSVVLSTVQLHSPSTQATWWIGKLTSNWTLNFHLNHRVPGAKCVVPENIHTPPTEGIGNSWGVGVPKDQKISRNVWGWIGISRGMGGSYINTFRGKGMDILWNYTMELHHITKIGEFEWVYKVRTCLLLILCYCLSLEVKGKQNWCIVPNLVFELLSTVYLNVKIALIFRENINMFVW